MAIDVVYQLLLSTMLRVMSKVLKVISVYLFTNKANFCIRFSFYQNTESVSGCKHSVWLCLSNKV